MSVFEKFQKKVRQNKKNNLKNLPLEQLNREIVFDADSLNVLLFWARKLGINPKGLSERDLKEKIVQQVENQKLRRADIGYEVKQILSQSREKKTSQKVSLPFKDFEHIDEAADPLFEDEPELHQINGELKFEEKNYIRDLKLAEGDAEKYGFLNVNAYDQFRNIISYLRAYLRGKINTVIEGDYTAQFMKLWNILSEENKSIFIYEYFDKASIQDNPLTVLEKFIRDLREKAIITIEQDIVAYLQSFLHVVRAKFYLSSALAIRAQLNEADETRVRLLLQSLIKTAEMSMKVKSLQTQSIEEKLVELGLITVESLKPLTSYKELQDYTHNLLYYSKSIQEKKNLDDLLQLPNVAVFEREFNKLTPANEQKRSEYDQKRSEYDQKYGIVQLPVLQMEFALAYIRGGYNMRALDALNQYLLNKGYVPPAKSKVTKLNDYGLLNPYLSYTNRILPPRKVELQRVKKCMAQLGTNLAIRLIDGQNLVIPEWQLQNIGAYYLPSERFLQLLCDYTWRISSTIEPVVELTLTKENLPQELKQTNVLTVRVEIVKVSPKGEILPTSGYELNSILRKASEEFSIPKVDAQTILKTPVNLLAPDYPRRLLLVTSRYPEIPEKYPQSLLPVRNIERSMDAKENLFKLIRTSHPELSFEEFQLKGSKEKPVDVIDAIFELFYAEHQHLTLEEFYLKGLFCFAPWIPFFMSFSWKKEIRNEGREIEFSGMFAVGKLNYKKKIEKKTIGVEMIEEETANIGVIPEFKVLLNAVPKLKDLLETEKLSTDFLDKFTPPNILKIPSIILPRMDALGLMEGIERLLKPALYTPKYWILEQLEKGRITPQGFYHMTLEQKLPEETDFISLSKAITQYLYDFGNTVLIRGFAPPMLKVIPLDEVERKLNRITGVRESNFLASATTFEEICPVSIGNRSDYVMITNQGSTNCYAIDQLLEQFAQGNFLDQNEVKFSEEIIASIQERYLPTKKTSRKDDSLIEVLQLAKKDSKVDQDQLQKEFNQHFELKDLYLQPESVVEKLLDEFSSNSHVCAQCKQKTDAAITSLVADNKGKRYQAHFCQIKCLNQFNFENRVHPEEIE